MTLRAHQGEHFVVTGAGTGIGRAIALRLAQEGADLTLLARDADRLQATSRACIEAGSAEVFVASCDIRDRAQVDQALDDAAKAIGPFRGIVANAGVGGPNEPGADDRFDDLVATNLVGTYSCLRAAQRHLVDGPTRRHMVVISSILGRFGVPGYTGYCASKAGLLGLVKALALELAPDRVLVNAICPGWVDTEMSRQGVQGFADEQGVTFQQALADAMSHVPLGRMSTPEEIAGTVSWLLSRDGAMVTGQGIDVNGGAWMG